jgi:uncharacterized protein (TIGR02246 family)
MKKVCPMNLASVLSSLCLVGLVIGASAARSDPPRQGPATPNQPGAGTGGEAEAVLRAVVAEFTRSFNAGDARAIAALFTENARLVTVTGRTIEGRAAIEKLFATAFEENPGQTIEVKTETLRFLGAEAAIEEGTATITRPGSTGETTRYSAAYVKRDGKWLQDSIRDEALAQPEPEKEMSPHQHLKELEWLVGEWIDENDEGEVDTTCRWSDNQMFLIRSFEVKIRGRAAMSGTQRIGWDPRLKQIRSWVFDSEGGFSEGFWSREGDRWVIKTSGVLRDGRTASASNVLTRHGADTIKWTSTDRTLGAEILPDTEEIVLVRKPPRPRSSLKGNQPARTPR